MSVIVLDAGNSIIKAMIAMRQDGEVSFPHAIQKLTEAEYRSITNRAQGTRTGRRIPAN